MKKYSFYILIIAILATIVLVLVFNDKPGTITGSEKNFAITDTSNITKIRYIKNGEVMELTKPSSIWIVNKKYPAKKQLVNATLQFLQQFNVISAVPKEMTAKAIETLNEKSLQVTVEAENKILVQYRFCEIDTAPTKAWIIMEGSSKPYIANLIGYEIPLFTIFPTSEMMWRDTKVFRTPVSDMLMAGLAYPKHPEKNFSISKKDSSFQLKQGDSIEKSIDKESISQFLMSINNLKIDRFATYSDDIKYSSIKNEIPYAEIIVKNIDNSLETIKVYQIISNVKNAPKTNPDNLLGIIGSDTIPVLLKYIDIDPLLKVKEDFLGK